MKVTAERFPTEKGMATLIKITNKNGGYVLLSSYGAGVVEVGVPDRNGKIENVALRYANLTDYLYDGPNMGKIPGRYANRIAEGKLTVSGKEYQLDVNLPPHHLHGGKDGFANRLWRSEIFENGVRFVYLSPDGEENYPGEVMVSATYRWSEDNELSLDFEATCQSETVINLTNHTYWNLDGADAGTALHHELKMKAHHWLPTDKTQIPTGELAAVEGTPMDFTEWKEIGDEINADFEPLKIGKGYDHCWVIDDWKPGEMMQDVVEMRSPESGRILRISSDQPGVQVYSGNWLKGSAPNCSGKGYEDYDGIAIEMQGYPDAPNHPEFPSQTLKPGETYRRNILFSFSAED